jgi:transcriptional regulator with XRE-family HTH domain
MARAALRLSVKDFAQRAHVSANTIVRFENERHEANAATLLAIKAAFEVAGVRFVGSGVFPPEKREAK